ncbi:hypothetical protein H0H93_000857 [Arthromyces matolae]|nr:hypothetical protein H0H93_000857 [Arthromyces matolae]
MSSRKTTPPQPASRRTLRSNSTPGEMVAGIVKEPKGLRQGSKVKKIRTPVLTTPGAANPVMISQTAPKTPVMTSQGAAVNSEETTEPVATRDSYASIVRRRSPSPSANVTPRASSAKTDLGFGSSPLTVLEGFQPSSPRKGPFVAGNVTIYQKPKPTSPLKSSPLKTSEPVVPASLTQPLASTSMPQPLAPVPNPLAKLKEAVHAARANTSVPTGDREPSTTELAPSVAATSNIGTDAAPVTQTSITVNANEGTDAAIASGSRAQSSTEKLYRMSAKLAAYNQSLDKDPREAAEVQKTEFSGPPSAINISRVTHAGTSSTRPPENVALSRYVDQDPLNPAPEPSDSDSSQSGSTRKSRKKKAYRMKTKLRKESKTESTANNVSREAGLTFSHVEIVTRPTGPPSRMSPMKKTKASPPLTQIPTVADLAAIDCEESDAPADSSSHSRNRRRLALSDQREQQKHLNITLTGSGDDVPVVVELLADCQYDFRSITHGMAFCSELCETKAGREADSAAWQVLVESEWCECPPGWGPDVEEDLDRFRSDYGGFDPTSDVELVFYHKRNENETFAYVGRLEQGEQDEYDRNTLARSWNDVMDYPIPVGYRAPRFNFATTYRVPDSMIAELDTKLAHLHEIITNRYMDDEDDDEEAVDEEDDGDSGSSYGEAARRRKTEAVRLAKQLNRPPPSSTSDEDEELDQSLRRRKRQKTKSQSTPSLPSLNIPPISLDHTPIPQPSPIPDDSEPEPEVLPRQSEKSKGKQRAIPDDFESADETHRQRSSSPPTWAHAWLNDSSADENTKSTCKGGRPSKEDTESLNQLRAHIWKSIHEFQNLHHSSMSVAHVVRYCFNVPGAGIPKRNKYVVFKEYMGAFPAGIPDNIKTPKGKKPGMQAHNAKVNIAYREAFGKLSAAEQAAMIRTMEDQLILRKGPPTKAQLIRATKKTGENLMKIAQEVHRVWGLNVLGGVLPDSSDPAVLAKAALFFGNARMKPILEKYNVPVRGAMDFMTTLLKCVYLP